MRRKCPNLNLHPHPNSDHSCLVARINGIHRNVGQGEQGHTDVKPIEKKLKKNKVRTYTPEMPLLVLAITSH